MDPRPDAFSRFLAELKRRHVYRVAAVYVVVAWAVIQAATTALPYLNVPTWVIRGIIVLAMAGFPVALVLGWLFDVTPAGIRRTGTSSGQGAADGGHPTRSLAMAGVMVVVVAVGVLGGVYAWHAADERATAARPAEPDSEAAAPVPPAPPPAARGEPDEMRRRIAEQLRSTARELESGRRPAPTAPGGVPIVMPNIDSMTKAALEAARRGGLPRDVGLLAGIRSGAYRRVAVLPFTQAAPPGVPDWRRAVQDTLGLALRDVVGLEPVPVEAVRAALAKEGLGPTDDPGLDEARRVAQRLGADLFVTGHFSRTADWFTMEFAITATALPAQRRAVAALGKSGELRRSLSNALKDLRRG
ncbi:MAG TPA: hypothetical protein VFQ38_02855 [Longimicrobiales bacterium]|nr:hypothetical protein [Longimicrobiales bacterium]